MPAGQKPKEATASTSHKTPNKASKNQLPPAKKGPPAKKEPPAKKGPPTSSSKTSSNISQSVSIHEEDSREGQNSNEVTSLTASEVSVIIDRRPPKDMGKWENFKKFLWNKERHAVCGRTALSWLGVIVYYSTFITIMFGVLIILINVLTDHIKKNHKVPIIPKKIATVIVRSDGNSLLWYKSSSHEEDSPESDNQLSYVKSIDDLLKRYESAGPVTECKENATRSEPCLFDTASMGPCGKTGMRFYNNKPCLYIKINKIRKWVPEYYDSAASLPREMPNSLKTVIKAASDKKKLWIHCDGLHPHDTQHLGEISYFPSQGVLGHYFPYEGQKNYLAPLVAIKLDNVQKGFFIDIRCSMWAKNINANNLKDYSSSAQIYLSMD